LLINNWAVSKRSHMTASLSLDDGQSWTRHLLLDARDGVSYPDAVVAPDGQISVLYDRGRTTDKEILLAQFYEKDVLECDAPAEAGEPLGRVISKA
jgi:hypothetical protein